MSREFDPLKEPRMAIAAGVSSLLAFCAFQLSCGIGGETTDRSDGEPQRDPKPKVGRVHHPLPYYVSGKHPDGTIDLDAYKVDQAAMDTNHQDGGTPAPMPPALRK